MSASLLGSLTPVGNLIGPIGQEVRDSEEVDATLFPEKSGGASIDTTRGLIVFSRGKERGCAFFAPDGSGGYLTAGMATEEDSGTAHYPRTQITTMKLGDYAAAITFANSPNPATDDFLVYLSPNYSDSTLYSSPKYSIASFTNQVDIGDRCLGMNIYPDGDATEESFWLVRDADTGFWEYSVSFQGGTVLDSGSGVIVNGGPAYTHLNEILPEGTVERCLYYHDAGPRPPNYSYVSIYSDQSWSTYRFADSAIASSAEAGPTLLSGITRRVDALLTTGRLLSVQDQIGTVYNADGKELTHFTLGNLKYCFEAYDGATAKVYFSQLLIMNGRMHFRIYSIPTSQLEALK